LLADDNENGMHMLINCWILDYLCSFLNKTLISFKYVCIKKWTHKISARFQSRTEISRDRNDLLDSKIPGPKRLRRSRPEWNGQTEKSS